MNPREFFRRAFLFIFLMAPVTVLAQGSHHDYEENEANVTVSPALLESLEFRALNFSRGGRATAGVGVPSQPLVYYFGGTGGGVWKTTDAGNNWTNVTDPATDEVTYALEVFNDSDLSELGWHHPQSD